jgi:manganese oxidase
MHTWSPRDRTGPPGALLRRLDHRLYLALLLVFGATAWEHVIHTFALGEVDSLSGHLSHILRDGMLALPLGLLAVWAGASLAARVWPASADGRRRLVVAAITAVLYGMLMVPSVGVHQQLDSHGAGVLAGGHASHLAAGGGLEAANSIGGLALHGLRDAAISQVVALPLLLVGLALLTGSTGARRRIRIPMRARLAAISTAATAFAMLSPYGTVPAQAQTAALPCSVTRTYAVSAIDLTITLNRFGDNDPFAYMYALDSRIPAIRAAEQANAASAAANQPASAVTPGLREDVIQPLMLRANLGECVKINFTNRLTRAPVTSNAPTAVTAVQAGGVPAVSITPQGVAYDIDNQGDAVGNNPNSMVPQNGMRTYTFYLDPALGEGAKVFRSGGDSRELTAHGLFGAILAEPAGSHWLDPETAADKTADATWANWEAIIDPASGPSFREFGIMYHEIGDEFFNVHNRAGNAIGMVDGTFSFAYRPASRGLNYRSEPFLDRLSLVVNDKAEGYSSYPFGDPATPIPRSYLGEPTKTRLMHPGSEQLHVHHLHGGGDRWRANPGADNTDIAGGLEKVPIQNAKSIRLDSQTVGPDESYNLEHECGAGGCQQAAGDYLYHCHIAHHYIAGMWSFWRVFDTLHQGTAGGLNGDRPLAVIPGRATPPTAVNSAGLLGKTVNAPQGPRTVVLKANLTNPGTQIALEDLVENQVPPQGTRIDREDAAVWDWVKDDTNPTAPVYKGEPEVAAGTMTNYESPTPGQRPDILFNPTTGRYTWPLLRPHAGQRPPFSPNGHTGAPWLGENTSAGRPDGLCPAANPRRTYDITAIATPVKMTDAVTEPNGEFFVLNKDRPSVTSTNAQPLAIRSNVGDCVAITLTNEIDYGNPDTASVELNHKVNMHTHFVQFDPQASDGVITGLSFEQAVRPAGKELTDPSVVGPDKLNLRRTLTAAAGVGATTLEVNSTERLRSGVWIAVGQGLPNIEIVQVSKTVAPTATTITLETPLTKAHASGESTGVEFVQYRWYSDVDSGTVFWHDHVDGIHSWSHGLFGAHIIEPKGSTYLDPKTLLPVDSGANVVIKPGTGAASPGVDATAGRSFREYMIWLHNGRPSVNPTFNFGQECEQGSINVRAEPFAERVPAALQKLEFGGGLCPDVVTTTDPYVFSSVKYGDPITPLFRAYVGDPVVVRTIGLDERVEALRIQGHRFRRERFNAQGELMDAATTGISERFDYVLEGGAGGLAHEPGDYLYYSTRNFAKEEGGWGIFRVHNTLQPDLKPLPDRTAPPTGAGFPLQTFTGGNPAPPSASTATNNPDPCAGVKPSAVRTYNLSIFDKPLPLQETINGDRPVVGGVTTMHDRIGFTSDGRGIVFGNADDEAAIKAGTKPLEPVAIRAKVGECVKINLTNHIQNTATDDSTNPYDGPVGGARAGIDLSKLLSDPQRSGGSAVGFNPDTTVAQNGTFTYSFMADKELGTSIFLNAGSQASQLHGAYGVLIVEPQGANWFDTKTGAGLDNVPATQAIVRSPSGNFRELVVMPTSTDAQNGRSLIGRARRASEGGDAYEDDVIGYSSINYQNEPLAPRLDPEADLTAAPLGVPTGPVLDPTGNADHSVAYSSTVHGDPDPGLIFRTYAGDPVRFRVAVPASYEFHVFNVAGHEFPWEPNLTGSHLLTARSLGAGETQEAKLVGNAGGTLHTAGDYLIQDGRQPFARSGDWALFRVLPNPLLQSTAKAVPDLAPVDG